MVQGGSNENQIYCTCILIKTYIIVVTHKAVLTSIHNLCFKQK